MKTIDEYINKVKEKENLSDGGSPAYFFDEDNVVLIKYTCSQEFCQSIFDVRKNEEQIRIEANKKHAKNVNTPQHIAIKRTIEGKNYVCWVLQSKAKGICYSNYKSNEQQTQMNLQKRILNAPQSHFDKCVSDLCEIFNMGLELKPKNIFYDQSPENGGFTFIDLLLSDPTPLNNESVKDILTLKSYITCIFSCLKVFAWPEIPESTNIYNQTLVKCIKAMENTLPTFSKYKRHIFRSFSDEEIAYFRTVGLIKEDLTLTEDEIKEFYQTIQTILTNSIEKIASNKYKLWQILANEIRIDLDRNGLQNSWHYHKDNKLKKDEFKNSYDYESSCQESLQNYVYELFKELLKKVCQTTENEFLLAANQELLENEKKNKL